MSTVRKHHPRGQDKYIEILREGQAKLEWEMKEKLVLEIVNKLKSLSKKDRMSVFYQFCTECGTNLDEDRCDC